MRNKIVILTVAAAVAAVLGFAVVHVSMAGGPPDTSPKSTFSVAAARAFDQFPVFSAGPRLDDLPLTAVLRRSDRRADYVSFIYGDCEPRDDVGCAPPVEIQTWPACKRHLALYGGGRSGAPSRRETTVRGAPAAVFADARLELQTGASTVVVFAAGEEKALAVARELRGVNVDVPAPAELPAPAAGAVAGKLSCG